MPEGFLPQTKCCWTPRSAQAEKGHGTVPSLIVPPWWPWLQGKAIQAYMFFFQPGQIIKATTVEIQHDSSQGSRWELKNLGNTKVISFNRSPNKPLSTPKTRCRTECPGYTITTLCFSWTVQATEQTTAASRRGLLYAVAENHNSLTRETHLFQVSKCSFKTHFSNLGPNCARAQKGHLSTIPL